MEVKRVPLESLHLDPSNARAHGPANMAAIEASLRRFEQVEPLIVQKGTGRVVAGNGRLAAMKAMGWSECAIVEVEADDLTVTALGIALNRTAELAEWDDGTLARLLEQLRAEDALEGIGYQPDEIDALVAGLDALSELEDEPEAPEAPDDPVSRTGDLWILGEHRLLCGDSSSAGDVNRLLAGQPIHLVNSDPPYNVKVEPRSKAAIAAGNSSFTGDAGAGKGGEGSGKLRAKDRPLVNDFVSEAEFERLLDAWFANIARVLLPGRGFYLWGGYSNCANYPPALATNGLYFSQAIIWHKQHPVITRKDFMGDHEWAFYGWREGAAHQFFGPNNATDVWSVQKVSPQKMVHLTEKPVELAIRALQYSSRRGENVLDLFGGSGSTLIACQQTERRGYLMEIDPAYVDVIVTRWEQMTGETARLEESGRSFAETSELRS